MQKTELILIGMAIAAFSFGVGHYFGERNMVATLGADVMSAEALLYLVEMDSRE